VIWVLGMQDLKLSIYCRIVETKVVKLTWTRLTPFKDDWLNTFNSEKDLKSIRHKVWQVNHVVVLPKFVNILHQHTSKKLTTSGIQMK
jgi:hypothetical protein